MSIESQDSYYFSGGSGLREESSNCPDFSEDPKVRFCETIKEIEGRLADEAVTLDSFIISTTPAPLVRNRWGKSDEWLAERHILFPEGDPDFAGRLLTAPQHSTGRGHPWGA